eukprot:GEMP01024572.1.p1 GENE.GEMP01024572.1~~GEMP01024572.1.p1  ORF type:complete len:418 (+),score=68.78 GEMP01024572.1:26-1255(+)
MTTNHRFPDLSPAHVVNERVYGVAHKPPELGSDQLANLHASRIRKKVRRHDSVHCEVVKGSYSGADSAPHNYRRGVRAETSPDHRWMNAGREYGPHSNGPLGNADLRDGRLMTLPSGGTRARTPAPRPSGPPVSPRPATLWARSISYDPTTFGDQMMPGEVEQYGPPRREQSYMQEPAANSYDGRGSRVGLQNKEVFKERGAPFEQRSDAIFPRTRATEPRAGQVDARLQRVLVQQFDQRGRESKTFIDRMCEVQRVPQRSDGYNNPSYWSTPDPGFYESPSGLRGGDQRPHDRVSGSYRATPDPGCRESPSRRRGDHHDQRSEDRIHALMTKTNMIHSVVQESVERVVQNSESVVDLEAKARRLSQASVVFCSTSKAVRRHFWMKAMKVSVGIAMLILTMLLLLFFLV